MAFGGEDSHFQWFPEHKSLLVKLMTCKDTANSTGSRAYFTWRGVRDFVNPRKSIAKLDFVNHLVNALKGQEKISREEQEVIL